LTACAARDPAHRRDAADVRIVFPVHANPAVRAEIVHDTLGDDPRIELIQPTDYQTFIKLMDASWLVLTDSGGVQEEAPVLGRPVLVLRETTERPEAIECRRRACDRHRSGCHRPTHARAARQPG
jgi:UDP-N-acetylglucosamine 2-epimerase (non-hydrolysing)